MGKKIPQTGDADLLTNAESSTNLKIFFLDATLLSVESLDIGN